MNKSQTPVARIDVCSIRTLSRPISPISNANNYGTISITSSGLGVAVWMRIRWDRKGNAPAGIKSRAAARIAVVHVCVSHARSGRCRGNGLRRRRIPPIGYVVPPVWSESVWVYPPYRTVPRAYVEIQPAAAPDWVFTYEAPRLRIVIAGAIEVDARLWIKITCRVPE